MTVLLAAHSKTITERVLYKRFLCKMLTQVQHDKKSESVSFGLNFRNAFGSACFSFFTTISFFLHRNKKKEMNITNSEKKHNLHASSKVLQWLSQTTPSAKIFNRQRALP